MYDDEEKDRPASHSEMVIGVGILLTLAAAAAFIGSFMSALARLIFG